MEDELEFLQGPQPLPPRVPAEQPESTLGRMLRKLHIPCGRLPTCRHSFGCIQSILRDSSKTALYGFLVKLGLQIIFKIRPLVRSPSLLLKVVDGKSAVRSGLFAGVFVLTYKAILCMMKRYVREERQRLIPLLAGAVGGVLACFFLDRPLRIGFALFLLARAIDISYKELVRRELLPEWRHFHLIIYSLCMAMAAYAYTNRPTNSLPAELNQYSLTLSNQPYGGMQMREIWIKGKNNEFAVRSITSNESFLYWMPKLREYLYSMMSQS